MYLNPNKIQICFTSFRRLINNCFVLCAFKNRHCIDISQIYIETIKTAPYSETSVPYFHLSNMYKSKLSST